MVARLTLYVSPNTELVDRVVISRQFTTFLQDERDRHIMAERAENKADSLGKSYALQMYKYTFMLPFTSIEFRHFSILAKSSIGFQVTDITTRS